MSIALALLVMTEQRQGTYEGQRSGGEEVASLVCGLVDEFRPLNSTVGSSSVNLLLNDVFC